MLATRIIPSILMDKGQLVKGEQFKADRVVGNALQAAKIHAARGVDELLLLDVTATKEGREPDYETVRKLADGCFAPLTVGGGIKTEEHVKKLLRAGADKICIGSASYNHEFIRKISEKFGSQCIMISVDIASIYFDKNLAGKIKNDFERNGAGEILLQSMQFDGTMKGYDLMTIIDVARFVDIPVIASGGCSSYEDMYNAIQAGASAVAAGALFQFTEATPREAAKYLKEKGINVRL